MASTTAVHAIATNETKNSRKKKGKSSESTNTPSQADVSPGPEARIPHGGDGANGTDVDSPYLREIHKQAFSRPNTLLRLG